MYGVTLQIFVYTSLTVAKSVPDAAGPTVDPAALFPPATVEAVLVFDPVGADAGALVEAGTLLEAGAGADALDMARCIQVF